MASHDASRTRRTIAGVLIAAASLLVFVGVFAVWVNRQVLDTDNWTRTSSQLLEQPQVRAQLAARLTDGVFASVDVEQALRDVLPARAAPLASPAANALRTQVEKTARRALARPDFQARWEDANRAAHTQLLAVLDGGGRTLSTADGVVVLDVGELLGQLQQRVGIGGRLSKALPPGATRIVLLRSNELRAGQTAVRVLRPLPVILLLAAVGLLAIAIAIAPGWRRRALRGFGSGLVVAGLAALLTRTLAGDVLVSSLAATAAAEPTVATVWTIATEMLVSIAEALIAYGVVIVIAAWIGGPTRPATALRRAAAPYLREPAIAYAIVAVAIAGLVWWAPTPAWRNVAMTLILAALLVAGAEALRRQVIREFPDRTRQAAARRLHRQWGRLVAAGRRRGAALGGSAQAPGTATVARLASAEDERLAQLERLGQLRAAGVLDDDELRAEKDRILHTPPVDGETVTTT